MRLDRTGGCPVTAGFQDGFSENRAAAEAILRSTTQRAEETPDGLVRWKTAAGDLWAPGRTDWAFVLSEQMVDVYAVRDRLRPGGVVLDCGANIGTFVRKALDAGAGLVVAIEPVPYNVECLRRNFREEIESGRVRVVAKGVWDRPDTLRMYLYNNSALDSFLMAQRSEEAGKPREIELPLTTIDAIASELKLERVDFIKMDVEGAERKALQGAAGVIRKFRPRMSIATENLPDDHRAVPTAVEAIAPVYVRKCGPYTRTGLLESRPDVLYFDPR